MRSISFLVIVVTSMLMVNCGSNKNKQPDKQFSQPEDIPVGTALAEFQIVKRDSLLLKDNQLSVKVLHVAGYGAGAGLLPTNKIIILEVSGALQDSALMGKPVGHTLKAYVRKPSAGIDMEQNSGRWIIVELEQN